jgi:hypothetical protein
LEYLFLTLFTQYSRNCNLHYAVVGTGLNRGGRPSCCQCNVNSAVQTQVGCLSPLSLQVHRTLDINSLKKTEKGAQLEAFTRAKTYWIVQHHLAVDQIVAKYIISASDVNKVGALLPRVCDAYVYCCVC